MVNDDRPDLTNVINVMDLDREFFRSSSKTITGKQLLERAATLAPKLPDHAGAALNFDQRDCFSVGLLSLWLRGQMALLPASTAMQNTVDLDEICSSTFCLMDKEDSSQGSEARFIDSTLEAGCQVLSEPSLKDEFKAICIFTSGSTGRPEPNVKTWGSLVASAEPIAKMIGLDQLNDPTVVATVPCDHMYGFELTVLLVLYAGIRAHTGKAFYPDDVARCLHDIPAPRVLVTTPFHLRLLKDSEVELPQIARIISATAPLSAEYAAKLEDWFDAPIYEIYGFTEAGSVGSRRTVEGLGWKLRDDLSVFERNDLQYVKNSFSGEFIPFPDTVRIIDKNHITLESRNQDLVKVAGKRESLANLSGILTQIDGVLDGAYALSTEDRGIGVPTRLTAVVVAPSLTDKEIKETLRKRIDPVFLPRKIYRVSELPRNETGKLPQTALESLISSLANVASGS